MAIVGALACVDEVFLEESLEKKKEYCLRYRADCLVMGDDHLNEYNDMLAGVCECEYLARAEGVSSTMIKRHLSTDSINSLDTDSCYSGSFPSSRCQSFDQSLSMIGEEIDKTEVKDLKASSPPKDDKASSP